MDSGSQTKNPNRTKWTPKSSGRICLLYSVDGIPSKANLLPTMHRAMTQKGEKLDALFSNTHCQQRNTGKER